MMFRLEVCHFMASASVDNLVGTLRQHRLLEPGQLEEVGRLQARFADPRDLARELLKRGWLTPYQVNQILQGKAAELVLGTYLILERLGEGGMGQVFKAKHLRMGRVVALKVIRKERLSNPDTIRRFHREIQVAASLSHPNVVLAFDADQIGDTHLFVMEYVDGIDLSRLVKERGPLPIPDACDYIRQAALGLQHAHERGLVHRDIKPSNLLLTGVAFSRDPQGSAPLQVAAKPVVKLLDLGLAKVMSPSEDAATLTQMGTVVGTPDYIAPEQARDSRGADIRADIYSLGCTLYYLLIGRVPFSGGTVTEKLLKHHMEEIPDPEKLRPEVPAPVSVIVRKMMAKKVEDRYQTPAEVAAALEEVIQTGAAIPKGKPASARVKKAKRGFFPIAAPAFAGSTAGPGDPTMLTPRPGKMRRRILFLAAGGLVAVIGFVGLWSVAYLFRSGSQGGIGGTERFRSGSPLDKLSADAIPEMERVGAQPRELVAVLGEHRGRHYGRAVEGLAFSPDNALIASAAEDGIRLWDAATLRQIEHLHKPMGKVRCLTFAPNGKKLAAGDGGGSIWLWEVQGSREPMEMKAHRGAVRSLAFSPNSQFLVSGGADKSVRLWTVAGNTLQRGDRLVAHQGAVSALAFSPDGRILATGAEDKVIGLMEFSQMGVRPRPPNILPGHTKVVHALAFSPDSQTLASASEDGTVRLWEHLAPQPTERTEPLNLGAPVHGVAFLPDGKLVCGSTTGLAVCEAAGRNLEVRSATQDLSGVMVVAASKGSALAYGTAGGAIRVLDYTGGELRERLAPRGHTSWIFSMAFSPDSKTLASASKDRTVRLWDLTGAEPKERNVLQGQNLGVISVSFSADGKKVAAAGLDPKVRIWDLSGSSPRESSFDAHTYTWAAAFSPTSKTLATGGIDGEVANVKLWDLSGDTPKEQTTFTGHKSLTALAFAPNGQTLLSSGGFDKSVRTWDLAGGKPGRSYEGKQWVGITGVAIAPDSQTLAFGADTGTKDRPAFSVFLWRPGEPEPKELVSSPRFSSMIWSVAFSPDGATLASAGEEGRVILWDVASGKETGAGWQLPGGVYNLAYAPDGRHLAIANANGTIYILRLAAPGK